MPASTRRSPKAHCLNLQPHPFNSSAKLDPLAGPCFTVALFHQPVRFIERSREFGKPVGPLPSGIFNGTSNHAYPRS